MIREHQIVTSALVLGTAIVVSAALGSRAITTIKSERETVTVTGSARKQITSDLIIWRSFVSYQSGDMETSFREVKSGMAKLRSYLEAQGIPGEQIVETSIQTQTLYDVTEEGMQTNRVVGYRLQQGVEIRSSDVDRITRVSRQATDLIEQGVPLESWPPEYLYTKLGDLKIEMLAEAAGDARTRADKIAEATGGRAGKARSARMGVLQITPAFSNEISDYGMNDTSSLEKDITAVVTIEFEID